MGNEVEEQPDKHEIARKKLQERREAVLALMKGLDGAEASIVLVSAMNELLLPVGRSVRFVMRDLASCE